MALQFRRYRESQIFIFDFGGSARAATLAMGGDWNDLGGSLAEDAIDPVALQPLARINEVAERAWAAEWIAAILARENVTVTPEVKEHLWSALTSLASAPIDERTLTGLSVLLQSNALKRALQPFCLGGPHGRLLDAEAEFLGEADIQTFETEGLIGSSAAPAVLAYLFHRIEGRLIGTPSLIIIDEGWLALDDKGFASQLREWLKTLRKKNASVVFATQSLADIETSPIAPAIVESCLTRLFLPNERALEPQITAHLSPLRLERPPDRDHRAGDAEARLLLPVAARQSAVRTWPRPAGARALRRLLQDRPETHLRTLRRARARRFCPRLARLARPRLGRRSSPPRRQSGAILMIKLRHFASASGLALALCLSLAPLSPSQAQSVVFDPSNYAQNIMTAAHTLQQINNQITSLQNQARSLLNQAKNLANLPFSSLQAVQQSLTQTQQLLQQAQRIAYDIQQIDKAFSTQYGPVNSSTSSSALIAGAQQRWQNSLASFQDAMRVQAGIVQAIDTARSQASALVSSSQSAAGALQTSQAGNQILALQSKQLADVTALLASQGRAQSLEMARAAEAQEQGREQMSRFIAPGQGYQPGNVSMFH